MSKRYWKTDWFIGLAVVLAVLLAAGKGPLHDLEWLAYDLGVRFSSTDPANSDVVVVTIDDRAVEALGAWPWPRDILAEATRILSRQRPAVIGFAFPLDSAQTPYGLAYIQELKDVIESTPRLRTKTIQRLLHNAESRMDTDRIFARSLAGAGRVVLAMPYLIGREHHPGTEAVLPDYLKKFTLRDVEPESLPSPLAYDMVINGTEVGGGSIRIHRADIQAAVFRLLGIADEEANEKFGFLLDALKYGCPPHGGIAFGLDRLVMLMAGERSIREVMAFPKTQSGNCLLTQAPAPVSDAQLKELHIGIRKKPSAGKS